jgi:hypothetical protein
MRCITPSEANELEPDAPPESNKPIDKRLLRYPPHPNAHPLVRELDEALTLSGKSYKSVCRRAGVGRDTFQRMKNTRNGNPYVQTLEALGGALGMKLVWVRDEDGE